MLFRAQAQRGALDVEHHPLILDISFCLKDFRESWCAAIQIRANPDVCIRRRCANANAVPPASLIRSTSIR
jgi:hypothetical protein